jgi:hypothetical protein
VNDNSIQLDRPGIFRAKPFDWSIQPSKETKSVAISIGFLIEAQYENGEWTSWADYEPHTTRGWFYVVGKTGQPNQTAIDQLVKSLNWFGTLKEIQSPPPDVTVQINVKANEYNGKTTFKVAWLNPGDYVPEAPGASDDDVSKLHLQFGSLLRAAAASARPKGVAPKAAPAKVTAKKAAPMASPPDMEFAPPIDDNADVPL